MVCETTGPTEAGLPYVVWDQLDDGTYVYGYYLDTPGDGYHPALATCSGSSGGPQPPPGGGPSTPPPPPPGGGESLPPNKFNAAGAAAWARANVKSSDNPYGYGDDCTDFVSRAMHFGGGMPFIDVSGFVNNKDDNNWYAYVLAGLRIRTHSWGSAPDLATFLRSTGWRREIGASPPLRAT